MLPLSHLHPFISHFPIALIIIALLFEVIGIVFKKSFYSQMSNVLLVIGTVSAIAAVLSGVFLTGEPQGTAANIYEKHRISSFITVALGVIGSLIKLYAGMKRPGSRGLKYLSLLLLIAVFLAVCVSGYYGGVLVYDYLIPKR
jgi:uncharacterized membrane protein